MPGIFGVAIAACLLAAHAVGMSAREELLDQNSAGHCLNAESCTIEGAPSAHQDSGRAVVGSSMLQSKAQVEAGQAAPRGAAERKFNGTVCFFVGTDTAPEDTDGRARAAATAETWAAEPAARSRVYYFVDEALEPYHLPATVRKEQIIKTIRADYDNLPERTRSLLVRINAKPLLDKCDWFALVDDDTYVNTASVVAKASLLDASGLHYMGVVCRVLGWGHDLVNMIHGSFKMFSAAAVPLLAEVAAQCRLWQRGAWEDYEIARCLKHSGFSTSLQAESFGNYIHDNNRTAHPKTLQRALAQGSRTNTSMACLDFLHKMLPDDMRTFHEYVRGSPPCRNGLPALLSVAAPAA